MLLSHGGSSRGISCLLFTRIIAEVTVFSHEFSFCPELSNLRIGFVTRKITDGHGLIVPRLVLWTHCPTGSHLRLVEFFFTRRVTESLGIYVTNYRISFHTESHGGFLCHETCSLSRICELVFFTRNVADVAEVMRVEL